MIFTYLQVFASTAIDREAQRLKQTGDYPLQTQITAPEAERIGDIIYRNETGRNPIWLTSWNEGEFFASMGIGHFIWYPKNVETPYIESFPKLMEFIKYKRPNQAIPAWLKDTPIGFLPWDSKQEFDRDFEKQRLTRLRDFLSHPEIIGYQTEFIINRAQKSFYRVLAKASLTASQRTLMHIYTNMKTLLQNSVGRLSLVDYVNFKGEGISETETNPDGTGWGLYHVLKLMPNSVNDGKQANHNFAESAIDRLTHRTEQNPDSKRWLKGWIHRINTTYRPEVL